jgi:hypothetical protein
MNCMSPPDELIYQTPSNAVSQTDFTFYPPPLVAAWRRDKLPKNMTMDLPVIVAKDRRLYGSDLSKGAPPDLQPPGI